MNHISILEEVERPTRSDKAVKRGHFVIDKLDSYNVAIDIMNQR
ncbi:8694_t:CDS:2, partial [Scutellospora calospora]